MELLGQVAIVTGGSRGIGERISKALIKNGLKVVVIDNDITGKKLEEGYNSHDLTAKFFYCDITNKDKLEECFKKTLEIFGKINVLVNNAGIVDDTAGGWRNEIEINLTSLIQCSLFGLKYIEKGGIVVNISSLAGIHRDSLFPIYAATKGAVNYFTRSMGSPTQVGLSGVRMVSVCPGLTNTDMPKASFNKMWNYNSELVPMLKDRQIKYYAQKPESVALCIIDVIKSKESGTIWLVKNDKCKKIDYDLLLH